MEYFDRAGGPGGIAGDDKISQGMIFGSIFAHPKRVGEMSVSRCEATTAGMPSQIVA
jgi:hypothetical protein